MAILQFTKDLADEYEHLFALSKIRPEHNFEVNATVDRIFSPFNFAQYQRVETGTGVPAYVVGIIHSLEASFNFNAHLHNGDPLRDRTTHVPAGRPTIWNPPSEWFDSAIDALTMHDLNKWTNWTVPGIAYVLERYNGFGYRLNHPHVKSPYLWSFTTIYSAGRYIADGQFSDTAVSKQCGGMAALRRMIEIGKAVIPTPAVPADTGDVAVTPSVSQEHGAAPPMAAEPPPYPGHILQLDSSGPDITTLQLRLRMLGINPGSTDGDFGEQTEAAVRLFQARSVDESGDPLEIDGIVGQKTWAALFGITTPSAGVTQPPEGSLLAQVLKVAAPEVGVVEVPLGSNRGPRVEQYLNAVGPGLVPAPWCMAYVYWCFAQAATALGIPNPAPRTAGVKRSWQMAKSVRDAKIVLAAEAVRDPSLVVPGMVFYIDTGQGTGHAGFVADIVGGTLVTIEGNTSMAGLREGIGVFQRSKRKIKDISMGFVAFG